jgi:hypothetical protein
VVFSKFDWFEGISNDELCELYNLSDFRLSCSGGEGFGIPTIEAMACGCINIVPSNTCFPEIAGPFAVKDAGIEFRHGVFWGVPNIVGMVSETKDLHRNSIDRNMRRDFGLQEVMLKYDSKKVAAKWDKLLTFETTTDKGYAIRSFKNHVALTIIKATYLIAGNCKVFSLGIGPNGSILEYAKYSGMDITGIIAPDETEDVPDYLKLFVERDFGLPEKAYGNIGILFNTGKQYSNLGKMSWVFVHEPDANDVDVNKFLEGENLLRRPDLESKVSEKLGVQIAFQIWHTKYLGAVMPEGLK